PLPVLIEAAAGLGTLSLPGSADGIIRRVPLMVGVGGELQPGLALEAARLAQHASVYLIMSDPPMLATGELQLPLPPDALLRLLPVEPEARAARTLPAVDVIAQQADKGRLTDA